MAVSHLIKEPAFFAKFKVTPENAFAIYAEDEAMADFIIHGDIMIFDKSRTAPRNGKIFAVDYLGKLHIRQLWIEADGSWLLESRSPNKDAYPDQRFSADQLGSLRICGEFIYRQGG
ncbi:S24 family peptidase [Undibacterium sp.]|jgi:phage repressor protein C with HTH and peptisase S24 domain|uniref:S24 family peptidase n=1 Tax=Undibacterium sp. TaxID=1914977 RepID=UPI002BF0F57E|nr:S24 family peptidase [Undibacterium sp.]HTD06395.1 S24 family peptidase [Undibacterium sp.]